MPLTQPKRDNFLINRYVKDTGLSSKAVAKRCGVSHSQMYMARTRNVGPENAEKIARGVAAILELSLRERLELKAEIMGERGNLVRAYLGGPVQAAKTLGEYQADVSKVTDNRRTIPHPVGTRVLQKLEEMGAPEEAAPAPSPAGTPLVTLHTLNKQRTRSRARILLAEDNAVNQKVAVRMLEKLGYRVDVAANGLEALEALSRIPYAAVLMDVQMPEMDGYEATAEIRRRESESERSSRYTPIIAMTANAMQGDREKALEIGMDDYVTKPVKPEQLDAVLERWVLKADGEKTSALEGATNGSVIPGAATDPLDRGVLAGLHELGGRELLEELGELFLEGVPPQLEALREATEGDDASSVQRMAHTLKGSCGSMGATRMATICADLEGVEHSGELERAPVLVERLEAEFDRVRLALEAETERSRG